MKNRFTIFMISISLMGILLAPACKKKNNDPPLPADSTFAQKVDKILEDYITEGMAEGVVMYARNTKGDLYWNGVGLADVDEKFSTFLPDSITALFPFGTNITINQLLSHK